MFFTDYGSNNLKFWVSKQYRYGVNIKFIK